MAKDRFLTNVNGNDPIRDTNTIILRNAIGDLKNTYVKGKNTKYR